MSIFYIAAQVIAGVSFALAWWKGGRIERLAAAILVCDYLLTGLISWSPLPYAERAGMSVAFFTTVIFVWLAFRFDRWWLFVAAAALALCSLTGVIGLVHPDVTFYAAASAQIGLWIVVYAALIAGVGERWLAGEPSVGDVFFGLRSRRALKT